MGRGKRDRVAELFESANMMTLNASGIELVKGVSSEIRVRFLLPQDMVHDHQQTVGDGDTGLLSFRLAPAEGADRTADWDDEPTAYPIPTSTFPQW